MNYQKSYMILTLGVLGGAAVVFIGLSIITNSDSELIGSAIAGIGLIAMLGGIGQALIFYKCPRCGKRLNFRGKKPNYCPHCGCKLEL